VDDVGGFSLDMRRRPYVPHLPHEDRLRERGSRSKIEAAICHWPSIVARVPELHIDLKS
jgi:hypothetical protein